MASTTICVASFTCNVEASPLHQCHNPYSLPDYRGQSWECHWMEVMAPYQSAMAFQPKAAMTTVKEVHQEEDLQSSGDSSIGETGSDGSAPSSPTISTAHKSPYIFASAALCNHREHWDRLRGKRGYSYFKCHRCGHCWRQLVKKQNKQLQKSTVEEL